MSQCACGEDAGPAFINGKPVCPDCEKRFLDNERADEIKRLRLALQNVRIHTGHLPWADRELLVGLLASIARIVDAAGRGEELK